MGNESERSYQRQGEKDYNKRSRKVGAKRSLKQETRKCQKQIYSFIVLSSVTKEPTHSNNLLHWHSSSFLFPEEKIMQNMQN
jgi:hypothetical protein